MAKPRKVAFGALQPLNPVDRVVRRCRNDPQRRNEHFLKYNLGAATYDEAYARRYAEQYMAYLEGWIRKAADRGVQLLLLPEVALRPAVLAAPPKGIKPNANMLADALAIYAWSEKLFCDRAGRLARQAGMHIAASLPSAREGRIYNSGVILDERGRLIGRYDKVHLAPGEEEQHYTAGSSYPVIETRFGRCAFAICYDIQFPEHVACCALGGAQVILHPSNGYRLPDEGEGMGEHRLRVRASDHYCALVYASFAPGGRGSPGRSAVIAPNGDVVAVVRGRKAGIAVGEVEIGRKRAWPSDVRAAPDREQFRRARRRPETYGVLTDGRERDETHPGHRPPSDHQRVSGER